MGVSWATDLAMRVVAGAVADAVRAMPGARAAARAYLAGGTIEQIAGAVALVTPGTTDEAAIRGWRTTVDLLHHATLRDVLPAEVRAAVDAVADRL